jgi:NAD-dependent dihydropyrimidine dehydrogenase PreA subunit
VLYLDLFFRVSWPYAVPFSGLANAAGYRAIEMRPIKLATGQVPEGAFSPEEIEQMSRILAPFVKTDACVGCGLCEYRCHSAWVGQQKLLRRSAVNVKAPA